MICIYFSFKYTINRWPGGDDGPGLAWYFVTGPDIIFLMFLGFMYLVNTLCNAIYKN